MSGSVEHELRTHSEALRKLARLLVGAQEAEDRVQDIDRPNLTVRYEQGSASGLVC